MESEAHTPPASRRRLQFSLLSLLSLTTLTCLALGWWVWPRPIVVTSRLMATTTPIRVLPSADTAVPQITDYRTELLAALANPQLLNDAVAITGNGRLAMCRRSEPVEWIRDRLEIDTSNGTNIIITLTVPEYFKHDAIEFVDYITLRAYSDVTIKIARQTRAWTRRLVRERDKLAAQLKATTKQLEKLDGSSPASAEQAAALQELQATQRKSLAEFEHDINFSDSPDISAGNLQLVESATARDSTP